MLQFLRTVFLAALACVLLLVAFANAETVTLRLLPQGLGQALGMDHAYQVPLFLVILGALLAGIGWGLVWEWVREAPQRSAASEHRRTAARLEREVSRLRQSAPDDRDEVLALLDTAERPR